ncbi:MAG: magnesium transporter [Planctomycetota bacterium]
MSPDAAPEADFVELVRQGRWEEVERFAPVELALHLPDLSTEEQDALLARLGRELQAEVLSEADVSVRRTILERWEPSDVAALVPHLPLDDGADLLEKLDEDHSREVLDHVGPAQAREVEELMSHPSDSAGGMMTPDCIRLPQGFTAEEALGAVRNSLDAEMVSYIYVLDAQGCLQGVVSLRGLLMARPHETLSQIMTRDFIAAHVDDDREKVTEMARRYNFVALPVVDGMGRLKGIITVDDILDVMEEEASEDMFRLAGTGMGNPTLEPSLARVMKRLPFLAITLGGGSASAWILSQYQDQLTSLAQLSFFIPMVIGMAGNVGVQSSTVVVRGLATGEITDRRFLKVMGHELSVALWLALAFCTVSMVAVYGLHDRLHVAAEFSWVVGLGMASGILMAAISGTFIPLSCAKLGVDPALAAGPFVTTINDITGVLVYLQVARWLMHLL